MLKNKQKCDTISSMKAINRMFPSRTRVNVSSIHIKQRLTEMIFFVNEPISMQGISFEFEQLPFNVYSCEDAATAKGISLHEELKSLVLRIVPQNEKATLNDLCILHLPGDKMADLRAVKRDIKKHFNSDEAYLAYDTDLKLLGVAHGAVCPFLDKIWELTHLISEDLLDIKRVSTNSGRFNSCIYFHPNTLLKSPRYIIGNYSKQAE